MNFVLQVLQQIADNTATDNSVWVATVAGGAAILGASISAFISYFITKRTIRSQEKLEEYRLRANIVTTERLRWLQDIRGRVAGIYVELDMQYNLIKRPVPTQQTTSLQNTLDNYSSEVMGQVNMVTLMLNPEKDDQRNLRDSLQRSLVFMLQCFSQTTAQAQNFNDAQYAMIKQAVFDATTSIGIETWKQIKDLK